MNSVINPSNDQQLLLDNMRIPKGWHSGNPLITEDVWYNRYTSPAWINAQKGKGLLDVGPLRYSNQFTSAAPKANASRQRSTAFLESAKCNTTTRLHSTGQHRSEG